MQSELWLMPTNIQNLAQMLAAGLIMDPTGYQGDTYFKDITSDFPFSTTVFKNAIPAKYFSDLYSENGHASPAILVLDLANLDRLKVDKNGSDYIIQLPLPLSSLKKVILPNKSAQELFHNQFRNFSNLIDYKINKIEIEIDTKNNYFRTSPKTNSYPSHKIQIPIFEVDSVEKPNYAKAQLFGGALLTFYVLSNRSNTYLEIYKFLSMVFSTNIGKPSSTSRTFLTYLFYLIKCLIDEKRPANHKLSFFYDVLQEIISQKQSHSSEKLLTENIMGYIEKYPTDDPEIKRFVANLQKLSDARPSEIFDSSDGPFAHSLFLFFLRDTMDELLEFESKNPKVELTPIDLSFAVLLFCARSGYESLSFSSKSLRPLSDFITLLMTQAALRKPILKSRIIEPFYPPRYYLEALEDFTKNETYATALAKYYRWSTDDYTHTDLNISADIIDSIHGNFEDLHIVIKPNIPLSRFRKKVPDHESFLRLLSSSDPLPADLDEKFRVKLSEFHETNS